MSYFDWLALIAFSDGIQRGAYREVLDRLYSTDFYSCVRGDENRAKDGAFLRLKYEDEVGESCDKAGECSVLEMMVALSIRCEDQLMYDPDEGDRTSLWFWEMFDNLGLSCLHDDRFDEHEFYKILRTFLHREYYPDGYLGPFFIENFEGDMRKIELWYQLGYYLESKFL